MEDLKMCQIKDLIIVDECYVCQCPDCGELHLINVDKMDEILLEEFGLEDLDEDEYYEDPLEMAYDDLFEKMIGCKELTEIARVEGDYKTYVMLMNLYMSMVEMFD